MRLDHLLSKEEEVRVVLLSSCQSECKSIWLASVKVYFHKRRQTNGFIRSATERELFRRNSESGRVHERNNLIILVAMRLGDTPVLIPNTMVKT